MKNSSPLSAHLVIADLHDVPEDAKVLEGIAIPAEHADAFLADVQELAADKYGAAAFEERLKNDLNDGFTGDEHQERAGAIKKSKRRNAAIIGAAICLLLVAIFTASYTTHSDKGMQLDDVSSVLNAASSVEVEEKFPGAKFNEDGNLEIKGSCGEAAGTYTVYLENDAPHLVSFFPADSSQKDSVMDALETQFDGHDRYNSRQKYFEYNDSASNLLIKYHPSSGTYFYPN